VTVLTCRRMVNSLSKVTPRSRTASTCWIVLESIHSDTSCVLYTAASWSRSYTSHITDYILRTAPSGWWWLSFPYESIFANKWSSSCYWWDSSALLLLCGIWRIWLSSSATSATATSSHSHGLSNDRLPFSCQCPAPDWQADYLARVNGKNS